MSELYYHPEEHGLELLISVDTAGDWEFDITAIFQDPETGKTYWGHDSGCSCPYPFEGQGRDDLQPLPETADLLAIRINRSRTANWGRKMSVEDAHRLRRAARGERP